MELHYKSFCVGNPNYLVEANRPCYLKRLRNTKDFYFSYQQWVFQTIQCRPNFVLLISTVKLFRKTGNNPVLNTSEKPCPKNLQFKLLQNMQFMESTTRNFASMELKGSWVYKKTDDPYDILTWSFAVWQLKIIYLEGETISLHPLFNTWNIQFSFIFPRENGSSILYYWILYETFSSSPTCSQISRQ